MGYWRRRSGVSNEVLDMGINEMEESDGDFGEEKYEGTGIFTSFMGTSVRRLRIFERSKVARSERPTVGSHAPWLFQDGVFC